MSTSSTPSIMSILQRSNAPAHHNRALHDVDEKACPDYEVAVRRSNSNGTTSTGSSANVRWANSSGFDEHSAPLNITRRPSRPLPNRREKYVYTYRLLAGSTPLQFLISVEPTSGKPTAGDYTFSLSFRANGIERPICQPIVRSLKIDPRQLDFVVFIFPGKSSLPAGCLWSLRIWLRANGVDHRLFGDDELWVAKDPDFNAIGDASFARLKNVDTHQQVYNAYVGRAMVAFIAKWQRVEDNYYSYSLEYEANGVGAVLFEDFRMKVDGDPRTVTFLIYSVPITSMPVGASHRLRVWIRSLVPVSAADPSTSYVMPFADSYVYQRIWKTDDFKIGATLDFHSLGNKMVMGFASGGPETFITTNATSPASASDDWTGSPRSSRFQSYGGEKRNAFGF